jgi:hypothetical protein
LCHPQVNYRVRKILSLVLIVNLIKPANNVSWFCFSVVQQPCSGLVPLAVDVPTSHTIRCTQLVAKAATYTTHNKRKDADFEIATLGIERPQTGAVDRTVPSYLFAGSLNIVRIYTCVLLDVSFVQHSNCSLPRTPHAPHISSSM